VKITIAKKSKKLKGVVMGKGTGPEKGRNWKNWDKNYPLNGYKPKWKIELEKEEAEIKANKLLINNDVKLTEKGDDGLVKDEE